MRAPLLASRFLARKMLGPVSRGRKLTAAKPLLAEYPNNPFLIHVVAICQAMRGEYGEAGSWYSKGCSPSISRTALIQENLSAGTICSIH